MLEGYGIRLHVICVLAPAGPVRERDNYAGTGGEAHVYMRGYAYRFGGDEYCLLLYNVTNAEALSSIERLRARLASLVYEGTQKRTTVSIGAVVVHADCHLTEYEIQHAANDAKNFAKQNGRNRSATYRSSLLRADDLYIVDHDAV